MSEPEKKLYQTIINDKNLPAYKAEGPIKGDHSRGPKHAHNGLLRDETMNNMLNRTLADQLAPKATHWPPK